MRQRRVALAVAAVLAVAIVVIVAHRPARLPTDRVERSRAAVEELRRIEQMQRSFAEDAETPGAAGADSAPEAAEPRSATQEGAEES